MKTGYKIHQNLNCARENLFAVLFCCLANFAVKLQIWKLNFTELKEEIVNNVSLFHEDDSELTALPLLVDDNGHFSYFHSDSAQMVLKPDP